MVQEWEDTYTKMGGSIGAARTVRQARKLIEENWQEFRDKHSSFFDKNTAQFVQIMKPWEESGITANNLRGILLSNMSD